MKQDRGLMSKGSIYIDTVLAFVVSRGLAARREAGAAYAFASNGVT